MSVYRTHNIRIIQRESVCLWCLERKECSFISVGFYPEICEGSVVERQLSDPTAVSVSQSLWGAVAPLQGVLLCQQTFQLRRRTSGNQRPDQSQNIIIKVRLRERDTQRERGLYRCRTPSEVKGYCALTDDVLQHSLMSPEH